jgi:hypothetical protein
VLDNLSPDDLILIAEKSGISGSLDHDLSKKKTATEL